jgi:hypothetical protein
VTRNPIVEEVRAIRDEIAKRHGYDVGAIVRALQKASADEGRELVSLPPRRDSIRTRAAPVVDRESEP